MKPTRSVLRFAVSAAILALGACSYKGSGENTTEPAGPQRITKPATTDYPRKHRSVGLYIQQSSQAVMKRNVYVTCLDGVEYWVVPQEGLAPRIDRSTLQPALCEPKT